MEGSESALHEHCESCFRVFCSKHPDDCPIIDCSLHCGIRFHSCKAAEHKLLCSKDKVPCINAGNGCPLEMPRYALAKHLGKCPASVVHCTMEWNRWPVYSKERSARVPFTHKNYHAKYGQLDVALALRDQRILNQAMQAPHRTKRALRNNLTQRFPAVPFTRKNSREFSDGSELSQTEEEEEEDPEAPWEARKHPPGLSSSVCTHLFQNDQPDRPDTLKTIAELNPPSCRDCEEVATPEMSSPDDPSDNSVHLKNSQVHMTHETIQAMAMPKTFNIPQPPPLLLEEFLALDLNVESITRYQAKAKSMYTFLCAQCFRRDEYAWHFQNVHCDIQGGLNGWFEQRCPLAHYGCTYSFHRFQPSQQTSSVVFSPLLESFGIRPTTQQNEFSEDQFNEYRMTRRSLSKELTPEILTSASYNSAVRVNGIRRPSHDHLLADYFTSLPFEVLQHIATFLDGYSLCNLSLCNRFLRDVCQSLLPERGHVVQEWEKNKLTLKWEITFQRWSFSTAFTSVPKWEFTKVDHLSKHLQECPVYKPYVRTDPFEMIRDPSHLMEDNPSFWRPLQAMYPDYNFKWSPTFIECLKEAEQKLKEKKKEESSEAHETGISSEF